MKIRKREEDDAEISMSPMIDMVFLLLVFFIVAAKPIKPEADLGITLPGTVEQSDSVDMPDEQRIEIRADGAVSINDLPMDAMIDPTQAQSLPKLLRTLQRFKETTVANRTEALVTIKVHDDVPHQGIINVMDACAAAKIEGITFANDEEE